MDIDPRTLSPTDSSESPPEIPSSEIKTKLPNVPKLNTKFTTREMVKDSDGLSIGITRRQDAWAQLVASYPENLNYESLVAIYVELPGVDANERTADSTVRSYIKNPAIQSRIEQYRRVLGTSKLSLMAHRESIHDNIVNRWQSNLDIPVRTQDVLQSLKDRESIHGLTPKAQSDQITLILSNPRVQSALNIISSQDKQINETSNDISILKAK